MRMLFATKIYFYCLLPEYSAQCSARNIPFNSSCNTSRHVFDWRTPQNTPVGTLKSLRKSGMFRPEHAKCFLHLGAQTLAQEIVGMLRPEHSTWFCTQCSLCAVNSTLH